MKRFLTLALVGALALAGSSVAYANICAFDPAPAATLLYPFVSYNYELGAQGITTLWSITNVSSEAQIVHITVWTDFSVAILDFNILLTGYDLININMRDILRDGQLPVTTIAAHTESEGIADDGPVSDVNQIYGGPNPINPPDPEATTVLSPNRCSTTSQAYPGKFVTPIPDNILALFEGWLKSSQTVDRFHDNCVGAPFTPDPLPHWMTRDESSDTNMYITADVVNTCNKTFPDEFGYFTDEARAENVLTGLTKWVDAENRFSEVDNAVHLEADLDIGRVASTNPNADAFPITFYSRYANDPLLNNTSDWREPLPTGWSFSFDTRDAIDLETYVRAWKGTSDPDHKIVNDLLVDPPDQSPDDLTALNCLAYTYYAWDDDENVTTVQTNPWSQPGGEEVILNLLPLETQEVPVTQFNFIGEEGWMLFVWPASNAAVLDPFDQRPLNYQTWMGVKYVKAGDYSGATSGAVMANYNCFSQQVLPYLGVNFQYVGNFGYIESATSN